MNDWQLLYEGTRDVTPTALLTVARLRVALAAGTVDEGQVQKALAAGAAGVGELLETIGELEDSGNRELVESMDDGFDPYGRIV